MVFFSRAVDYLFSLAELKGADVRVEWVGSYKAPSVWTWEFRAQRYECASVALPGKRADFKILSVLVFDSFFLFLFFLYKTLLC